ncbi:MAG: MFS transporter [Candidatus Nezhaarchaeota archaeon]|nr:MFS transporter [Candidatus Nezhaarchaeota archaeon]
MYASNLTCAFGDGLLLYLVPYYVAKHLGASAVEVGTLYTASFLASAVTLLAGGVLADRYDRKKVILVGWLSWLPAPLLFSLAEDWGQMLIGMVLWGFWLSGPAYTAYVLSSTSSDRLATTFATLSSSWSLGYAFSPAVGGALAEALGIKAVFYAAFTLYAASCLMLAPISSQPPPRPLREGCVFKDMFKSKGFLALLALFSSISFINSMFHQLIPVFLTEAYSYTSFQVGLVGSASFIGSATLGVALGRLGDKYGRRYALTTSLLLCSSSLALLMLTGSLYVLLAAALLLGASYATWPLMSATVGPLAPRHARARWMSISQAVTMLSSFPAPYVGGLIYKGSPYALFAASMAALLSISLLLLGPLRKHVEQEAPQRWAAAL